MADSNHAIVLLVKRQQQRCLVSLPRCGAGHGTWLNLGGTSTGTQQEADVTGKTFKDNTVLDRHDGAAPLYRAIDASASGAIAMDPRLDLHAFFTKDGGHPSDFKPGPGTTAPSKHFCQPTNKAPCRKTSIMKGLIQRAFLYQGKNRWTSSHGEFEPGSGVLPPGTHCRWAPSSLRSSMCHDRRLPP